MREIKFRAWNEKKKRWHKDSDPDCVLEFDGSITQINVVGQYDGELFYSFDDKKGLILAQYTGLKDKNGKEIYEGDIVKISDHPFEGSITVNGKYEIGYNDYMELVCGSWLLFRMKNYCEVIGNIYENPELLEEK